MTSGECSVDQTFMKEKPVLPLVLKMALPMVISMLVNSLYNIVDSFFVAQVSEDAMTAISIVYPLQNLANAVGVGFGVGINAAVAYYLGAGNGKAANANIDTLNTRLKRIIKNFFMIFSPRGKAVYQFFFAVSLVLPRRSSTMRTNISTV